MAEIDKFIHEHGLPILLKAAAGGGGKGMRVVRHQEEIENALARTQSEALSSFHDDRVFIEKFIENPRHIEIQILGDHHGNILHFGERDCSLQRRHQKVIEETPAPHLCPSLRQQMITAALELAKSINYFSAGTVEFIVTPDHQFYFLEVNTRLQVEHPITEEVYGVDLVELMILIAEGKPLPFTQSPLSPQGHAIEARLYAEDPDNDFPPSSGQLVHYHSPSSSNYLRIDTGIREGDNVSIYYDPMLAKIIAKADSRSKALALLQQALSQFVIEGIDCNLSYLQRLLATPEVVQGHFHTHTIQEKNSLLSSSTPSLENLSFLFQQQLACIAFSIKLFFDPYLTSATQWVCAYKEEILEVTLLSKNRFQIHQTVFEVSLQWLYQHSVFTCSLNGHPFTGTFRHHQGHLYLTLEGQEYCFFVERASIWPLYSHLPLPSTTESSHLIKSPMPGILKSLYIKKGDSIKKGQPIAVIEAMKMENTLRAPQEGKIVDLKVQAGQNLTKAQIIACLE